MESRQASDVTLEFHQPSTSNTLIKIDPVQVPTQSVVTNEKSTATAVDAKKKRKSTGLFSCFSSKKSKASTEQQGRPIVTADSAAPGPVTHVSQTDDALRENPSIDYAVLPDGKRIYIDTFRDRPGVDMSYKPDDFDARFVLPVVRINQKLICIYSPFSCMARLGFDLISIASCICLFILRVRLRSCRTAKIPDAR